MFTSIRRWCVTRYRQIRTHPDRGAETVDIALWIGVTIVVVGGIGLLFRNAITDFFNSLVFTIGFGSGG